MADVAEAVALLTSTRSNSLANDRSIPYVRSIGWGALFGGLMSGGHPEDRTPATPFQSPALSSSASPTLSPDSATNEAVAAGTNNAVTAGPFADVDTTSLRIWTGTARLPAAPAQIGNYHILEPLGRGGMGTVYRAEQRVPVQRFVAVKLITAGFDTQELLARFDAERQALAMMDHPHIAKVLEAGSTETARPYFVMEYVAGSTTVTRFADAKQLTIRQRLDLFLQICSAIAHAHTKAIIHRDIKSANVLAFENDDAKPSVKVIDFGIAKALRPDRLTSMSLNTEVGAPIGTYAYMSPEQAAGSADIDTRTDVYSLGVLLYEFLSGELPFGIDHLSRLDHEQVCRLIREEEPPRPQTRLLKSPRADEIARGRDSSAAVICSELGSELEWIPLKAMRKDRSRRYESVSQLATDIENYLHDRPLVAGPESKRYRAKKFVSRNRGSLLTAGVVAMLFVATIATSFVLISHQRDRAIANEAKARVELARADDVTHFMVHMFAAADPRMGQGKDVRVADLLTAASNDLKSWSAKDPVVRASIGEAIGNSFQQLGMLDEAEINLRATVDAFEHSSQHSSPESRAAQYDLAGLLRARGKLAESHELFDKLISNDSGDTANRRVSHRTQFALLLQDQGDVPAASSQLASITSIDSADLDADTTYDLLTARASLLYQQGKPTESIKVWRELLARVQKNYGSRHAKAAETLSNLAVALADTDPKEAIRCAAEALSIQRETLPPAAPDLALSLNNLGQLQQSVGEFDVAKKCFDEALSIQRKAYPNGHVDTAATLNNLGLLEQFRHHDSDAIKLFDEACGIYKQLGFEDQPAAKLIAANAARLQAQLSTRPITGKMQ